MEFNGEYKESHHVTLSTTPWLPLPPSPPTETFAPILHWPRCRPRPHHLSCNMVNTPSAMSRFDHSCSIWYFNVARHSNKTKTNNFVCHQPIFGGGAISIPPEADPAHDFTLWNAAWFWNGWFFVRSHFHLPLKQLQRGVSKCTNKS